MTKIRLSALFAAILSTAPASALEVAIHVGKRIIGKAEVEFVVYLEGYLK